MGFRRLKSTKDPIVHKDKLEQTIGEGDCVAYADSNSLQIGTVIKLSPKMVKVARVGSRGYWSRGVLKYPCDVLKIDSEEATIFLLKNA